MTGLFGTSARANGTRDEEAFRSFVEASSTTLLRTAWLLTSDRWQAEDLVQTALTATYLHWRHVETPEAYARTSLIRDAIRGRRRRELEHPTAEVPDQPEPDGSDTSTTAMTVRAAPELSRAGRPVLSPHSARPVC